MVHAWVHIIDKEEKKLLFHSIPIKHLGTLPKLSYLVCNICLQCTEQNEHPFFWSLTFKLPSPILALHFPPHCSQAALLWFILNFWQLGRKCIWLHAIHEKNITQKKVHMHTCKYSAFSQPCSQSSLLWFIYMFFWNYAEIAFDHMQATSENISQKEAQMHMQVHFLSLTLFSIESALIHSQFSKIMRKVHLVTCRPRLKIFHKRSHKYTCKYSAFTLPCSLLWSWHFCADAGRMVKGRFSLKDIEIAPHWKVSCWNWVEGCLAFSACGRVAQYCIFCLKCALVIQRTILNRTNF